MISQTNVVIGDDEFTIQSLPATKALVLAATVAKIAGGAGRGVKDLPRNPKELVEALEQNVISIGGMVEGVLAQIDPAQATQLIKQLVRDSVVSPSFEGTAEVASKKFNEWYEARFSRSLSDLTQLLVEICVFNYGDPVTWLGKVRAWAVKVGLLLPSAPSSPETSEQQSAAS